MGCWYTPVSGIWQTVYIEAVGGTAVERIHITPDFDRHMCTADIALDRAPEAPAEIEVSLSFEGRPIRSIRTEISGKRITIPIDLVVQGSLEPTHVWTPEHPELYDAAVTLRREGQELDRVTT